MPAVTCQQVFPTLTHKTTWEFGTNKHTPKVSGSKATTLHALKLNTLVFKLTVTSLCLTQTKTMPSANALESLDKAIAQAMTASVSCTSEVPSPNTLTTRLLTLTTKLTHLSTHVAHLRAISGSLLARQSVPTNSTTACSPLPKLSFPISTSKTLTLVTTKAQSAPTSHLLPPSSFNEGFINMWLLFTMKNLT